MAEILAVCSYCQKKIRDLVTKEWRLASDKEIEELSKIRKVSHGICPECYDEEAAKIKRPDDKS